jgi:hypothetical protein
MRRPCVRPLLSHSHECGVPFRVEGRSLPQSRVQWKDLTHKFGHLPWKECPEPAHELAENSDFSNCIASKASVILVELFEW